MPDKMGKPPNMTDRELMIEHGAILREVCRNVKSLKSDNGVEHKSIFDRIDAISDNKVSNKLFYSTLSILVAVLIIISASLSVLNIKATTNTADIEHIEQKLNRANPE